MTVKPHTHDEAAGDMPQFLCRLCHPELCIPPAKRTPEPQDDEKALNEMLK